MKANGKRFGWQYVYNHNPDSAHFKYVGAKSGTTPILSEAGKEYAGGNSLEGHIGEGSREGSHGEDAKKKQEELSPKVKKMAEMFGKSSSSAGMRIGGGRGASGAAPPSQFQQARKEKKLEQQTKNRNDARRQVTERSQEMIKEVMAAVAQQNGVNSQAIQAAQQALAQVAGASRGGGQPQLISTGGGGSNTGSIASILQSNLNPLRGLLR